MDRWTIADCSWRPCSLLRWKAILRVELLLVLEAKGANVLNYARLDGFVKDKNGKIVGVEVYDKVRKMVMTVKAKHVVNAAGNFSDVIRKKDDPASKRRILHALGSHIMLDPSFCDRNMGILIPKTSDGRVLFIVPWMQSTIVGTTDVILDSPAIHPTPTPECRSILNRHGVLTERGQQSVSCDPTK